MVVTADGAIVREHTQKGLDGLAPAGTVRSIHGRSWDPPSADVDPRFGVIMNPYDLPPGVVRQLFIAEPFNDTIAVVNLSGTAPDQVFSLASVTRISSAALNLPVDLAPVQRDAKDVNWASNTTLDEDSDFYVANRGDNTIVRMKLDGTVVAIRRVAVPPGWGTRAFFALADNHNVLLRGLQRDDEDLEELFHRVLSATSPAGR